MQESQVLENGYFFLKNKRPIVLGFSLGNSFYFRVENLQRMLQFAESNSNQKTLLFLTEKISEHNYRAIGSKNPEKSARVHANRLRNKCVEAIKTTGIQEGSFEFIDWARDVENASAFVDALEKVKELYKVNQDFRKDIPESTMRALASLRNGREKNISESSKNKEIDVEEGVLYLLKELAFVSVLPNIYDECDKFVCVYHKPWQVFERFFDGEYGNIPKPFVGLFILE